MARKNTLANYGLIKSPPDERDYLLSSVSPDIKRYPEEYPRMFDLTITDQGVLPHCVGHAGATIKQFLELKENNPVIPDPNWLYYECKKIDGIPNFPGTYLRSVLQVLKNVGCRVNGDNDVSKYQIAEYRRLDDNTFEGIKKAIALYGVAIAGFTGSNSGWATEVIRPPRSGEATWGHAVALTHYFKDYLGGQNSWGTRYHRNGLFKVPKSYLPFEVWIPVLDKVNEPRGAVKTGWVARTFLDVNNRTTGMLNVREGAGTGFRILETLPGGTRVNLFGSANRFNGIHWWSEIII